ncbi:MAG: hypothetical protein K8F31_01905 [Roseovarius sp.]|nr:hypothetical protein [Roseovarius sp.]
MGASRRLNACLLFATLLTALLFGLYISSELVVTAQAPPPSGPSDDSLPVYHDAEAALAAADSFEAAGEVDRAFASYLTVLDSALAAGDELSISADANLDTLVDKVADNILSEAEADEIEAALPDWEEVQTPRAKNWLMRFADARRLRYASEGKYQEAYQATLDVRDMAWDIVSQSPNDPSVRKAIQVYYDTNQALGQREKATQDLSALEENLPPSVASFCIVYRKAQDAQKLGDAGALEQACSELLQLHAKGAITPALNDPFGDPIDKMLLEYHLAYAHYVLREFPSVLQRCDAILEKYAEASVSGGRTEPHGCYVMTDLVRTMTIAAMNPDDPAVGIAAYDFLTRYPDDKNAAAALLNKGILAEQIDSAMAESCFAQAATQFPESDSGTEAAKRQTELLAVVSP